MFNDDAVETVQIDNDRRIVVYQDFDANNPVEDLGDVVSVVDLRHGLFISDISVNVPDSLDVESIRDYSSNPIPEIIKHFKRNGWAATTGTIYVDNHEWGDVVFAVSDKGYGTPEMLADEAIAWANGEVYRFEAQSRHEWRDDDGNTTETWDVTDNLGCVYAGDDSIEDAAKRYAGDLVFTPRPLATA